MDVLCWPWPATPSTRSRGSRFSRVWSLLPATTGQSSLFCAAIVLNHIAGSINGWMVIAFLFYKYNKVEDDFELVYNGCSVVVKVIFINRKILQYTVCSIKSRILHSTFFVASHGDSNSPLYIIINRNERRHFKSVVDFI